MENSNETFAIRILKLKSQECMTAKEFAEFTGISKPTFEDWFSGRNGNPTMETLIKLAKAFDISLDYLCGLKEKP